MSKLPLKYLSYGVVMQEVPNEISLAINISGCTHKCRGCHSKELWEYEGKYISNDIEYLINKYGGMITCVCFMGGDQNLGELFNLLSVVKGSNLKTCLYSGEDEISKFVNILHLLDYIKCGRYDETLLTDDNIQYGIKLASSNQRIYKRGIDY